jgi:hypothetical protein
MSRPTRLSIAVEQGLVQNFVNLGRLYSIKQWQKPFTWRRVPVPVYNNTGLPKHGVNLGDLYRASRQRAQGWAYFEDGSVFVARHHHEHDVFQHTMNIAAQFVLGWSDAKGALISQTSYDSETRMIVLE